MAMKRVPSAIFCHNDLIAIGVMQELLALGVKIPSEISVLGFDDIVFARSAPVPLTTMRQPCREIGIAAMDTMLRRLQRPHMLPREVRIESELVLRESCGGKERDSIA